MSRLSIQRSLIRNDLHPHQYELWMHSKDPYFREKVNEIVSLYLDPPEDTVVISVDKKTVMRLWIVHKGLNLHYSAKPGVTKRSFSKCLKKNVRYFEAVVYYPALMKRSRFILAVIHSKKTEGCTFPQINPCPFWKCLRSTRSVGL